MKPNIFNICISLFILLCILQKRAVGQDNNKIYTSNVKVNSVAINEEDSAYCIQIKTSNDNIKARYFLPEKGTSVNANYQKWKTGKKIILYTSAGYISRKKDKTPDGLTIYNGKVLSDKVVSGKMDGLVIISAEGQVSIWNLKEGVLTQQNTKLNIRDSANHRKEFLAWANDKKATVFQTFLLYYNKDILVDDTNDNESPQRFLAICGDAGGGYVNVVVDFPFPLTLYTGLTRAIDIIKQCKIKEKDIYSVVSLATVGKPTLGKSWVGFMPYKVDGTEFTEFKGSKITSNAANLLVYYIDDKMSTQKPDQKPDQKTEATSGDLQSMVNYYYANQTSIDSLRNLDMASNISVSHNALKNEIRKKEANIAANAKNLYTHLTRMNGSYTLTLNRTAYSIYVSDLSKNDIQLNLNANRNGPHFSSLGAVKKTLERQGKTPLMITNGGMFTPEYNPQGLYIDEYKKIKYPLEKGRDERLGNFYYQPNGVFYIDDQNTPHIDSTQQVATKIENDDFHVKIATQSGPMLVINNRIHPIFTKGSQNLNIRSGVGIGSNNKVIFAISNTPTNFYDFAIFFRDILQCKNALYLDGAISQMYLHDLNPGAIGGNFGPVISVTKK